MTESGWIAVYRSILDPSHDLHPMATGEEACRLAAWVDLIGQAKWKDGGGLERGQLRASQSYLAKRWNWSRSKVRRFLDEMEEKGRVVTDRQGGRKATVITVCNYDVYQNSRPANRPATRTATDPQDIKGEQEEGLKQRIGGFFQKFSTTENGNGGGIVECDSCGADYVKDRGRCPVCDRERKLAST